MINPKSKILILLIFAIFLISGCTQDIETEGDTTPESQIEDNSPLQQIIENNPFSEQTNEPLEPVPAPNVSGKIKGYWSSRANMVMSELGDAEHMKEVGINTITFSPALSHTQEGRVIDRGSETYVKKAINKAHEAGFRVMLETTPMNAGEVAPKVTDPELFQNEMTRTALKYATIAEEFNVEYFAPIVEPAHHMSVEESDEWLQELLPKLREVYSGPIMWKKQSMHLSDAKQWDQDHILKMGFKISQKHFYVRIKSTMNHNIMLGVGPENFYLEEWDQSSGRQKFRIEEGVNLNRSQWHLLRLEIEGNYIRVFLNDELLIEHEDDGGPMGGYSITSEDLRINEFEITDMSGTPLLVEDFKSLNNWGAKNGWTLGDNEIIVTSHSESPLIHDIDFSGYDYIAIDTFRRGQAETSEHYLEHLEYVIDKTIDQAESDGVPYVIIAEFGGSIMEEVGWIDDDARAKIPITAEELAIVTQTVLEMAEEKGIDGYMYNGWDVPGQGINTLPEIEEVIKEWYNTH